MESDIIIELKKASISHPDNMVLSNINFQVSKGEFVYVIGKTGSGKSTLLKALYGELALTIGTGTVCNYNLNTLKSRQIPYLRRKLGIVFQDFQLLTDRSVYDNLMFVLKATGWKKKADMERRIQEVLDMVALSYKEYKMPHELSGGEQQRVVIARALLNNPEVILADEPTGNLDPNTSADIMRLLFDISKKGRAIIMATHDYPLMNQFPARVLECMDGKLVDYQNQIAQMDDAETGAETETES